MRRGPMLALAAVLVAGTGLFSWLSPHPGPPPIVLEVNGSEQVGSVGAYCWTTWGRGTCTDSEGVVTADEPLATSSPLAAVVYLSERGASEVVLRTYPVAPEDELELNGFGKRMWRLTERAWEASERHELSGLETHAAELRLSPGLYVFTVSTRWDGQGEASHGFLVQVNEGP